ncbi:MAG: hypothetical protein H7338_01440 [Candidatus Sericytochromatia bacterium]|nr:hypothetical protein [Candidatus Sericytochromatia bacterium]
MIGLFNFTPVAGVLVRLAYMAAALEARGHSVRRILCDGAMPRCSRDFSVPPASGRLSACLDCWPAMHTYARLGTADPATVLPLSSLLDPGAMAEARTTLAGIAADALVTYEWQGLPLGEGLDTAMRYEYWGEDWRRLPDWPAKARDWLLHATAAAMAATRFIDEHRPSALIVHNGRIPGEAAVMAVAARHGLPCFAEEGGIRPATLVLKDGQPACDYNFLTEWAAWRDVPLTAAEAATIEIDLASRRLKGHPGAFTYSPSPSGELDVLRRHLGLRPDRPVVTVFAGTTGDTAFYAAHDTFPTQSAWLAACIAFAASHPDVDLVLRAHPGEASFEAMRYGRMIPTAEPLPVVLAAITAKLPDNVRVVAADSPISSYDLLAISHVVLVYISTLAMEAAAGGWPVAAAGRSHYRDAGFVHPVHDAADFPHLIERLLADPEPLPELQTMARRYLYMWAFRAMGEFPLLYTDTSPDDPTTLAAFEAAAAVGHDLADRLAGTILGHRPWLPGPGELPATTPLTAAALTCLSVATRSCALTVIVAGSPDQPAGQTTLNSLAAWPLAQVIGGYRHAATGDDPTDAATVADWQEGLASAAGNAILLLQASETLVAERDLIRLAEIVSVPTIGLVAVHWAAGAITWEARWHSGPRSDMPLSGLGWDVQAASEIVLMPFHVRRADPAPAAGRVAASRVSVRQGLMHTPGQPDWHLAITAMAGHTYDRIAGRHLIFALQTAAHLIVGQTAKFRRQAESLAKRLGGRSERPAPFGHIRKAGPQSPTLVLPTDDGPSLTVAVVVAQHRTISAATLASIDGLATEILVYDQGRHPDTHRICHAHGALVLITDSTTPLRDILAHAMQHAQSDWVLLLQGDEMLTANGKTPLLACLEALPPGPATLAVSGAGTTLITRLYRRRDRHPSALGAAQTPMTHAEPGIRIHS